MSEIKTLALALCVALVFVLVLRSPTNRDDAIRARGERNILDAAALSVRLDALSVFVWQGLGLTGWVGGAFVYGQLVYCKQRLKEIDDASQH